MKILSAIQTKEADAFTIAHEPISSLDLMERAASRLCDELVNDIDQRTRILIICGTGNNGGDGLVLGRLLYDRGYDVSVFSLPFTQASPDYRTNLNRLPFQRLENLDAIDLALYDIVVDAMFGSGLNRPVEGDAANLIQKLNNLDAVRVAVDIPSGMFADKPSSGSVFCADVTFTFQLPKLAFMFPENAPYVGNWQAIDIGLHPNFLQEVNSEYTYVTHDFASRLVPRRPRFAHKGDFGKVLILAGSKGKMGASVLAARACLRSGAGLLTVQVPGIGLDVLQASVPEAMTIPDSSNDVLSEVPKLEPFNVIGVGPGIGTDSRTVDCLTQLITSTDKPMVLDADALNILALHPELLEKLPAGSVLTPHPGEFRRLAGDWDSDFHRLEKQRALSAKYNVVVVLKGAHTSVSIPDGHVFFNSTGNPGMATAGSGDVLTGVITGLLGQNLPAEFAAVLGVYLHGLAGDLASDHQSQPSMVAGDIIDEISNAYRLF